MDLCYPSKLINHQNAFARQTLCACRKYHRDKRRPAYTVYPRFICRAKATLSLVFMIGMSCHNHHPSQRQRHRSRIGRIRHHVTIEQVWDVVQLSIHIEISLQDALLERIRLLASWLCWGRSWSRSRYRRAGHLDAPGSVMRSRPGAERGGREGRTVGLGDGALSARPKLLGPVEATAFTWTRRNGKVRCSSRL
jgi:hypothetical protein